MVGVGIMVRHLMDGPKLIIVTNREWPVDQFVQGRFGYGWMHVVGKVSA